MTEPARARGVDGPDPARQIEGMSGRPSPAPLQRRYASPLIAERRTRILDETKKLIDEVGAERFTVRELGLRAGVSVTTIYNVFGDKEGVIAHALREFHAGIKLALPNNPAHLDKFLKAIGETTAIVIDNRGYTLALADLYFSRSLAPTLFDLIRSMPLQVFWQWLWGAERAGLLREGCDTGFAETSFANLEWAVIKDWAAGRIPDTRLAASRCRSFLLVVTSIVREPLRCEADDLLAGFGRGA